MTSRSIYAAGQVSWYCTAFCGDNQYDYEYGVGDDDILALMTSFTHNGKERKVTDFSYRFYVHRLMLKKRLRRFAGRVYHKLFDRSK